MELTGRFRDTYEFAIRTHIARKIRPEDSVFAQTYPKLTLLALSPEFNAKMAYDIILAKQRAEGGEDMFERTAEIGRSLAERYMYSRDPSLRPTPEQYETAKSELRKKQQDEES